MALHVIPVTFTEARRFTAAFHRHHGPPVAYRITCGVADERGILRGVAIAGYPVARALHDKLTLEVTRTCTDGTRNANSMLYAAIWRSARAIGYTRMITYTQEGEPGTSLRAAGWRIAAQIRPRAATPGQDFHGRTDGIWRTRWEIGTANPQPSRNGSVTAHLCGNCARKFLPQRSDTRYCCNACRQAAYRVRAAASRV